MVGTIDISSLVKQPKSITQSSVETLEEGVSQYPWCSGYHILLARGYANEQSHLQKKQLRLASTYAGNRERLFSFFHDQHVEGKRSKMTVESKESVLPINTESTIVKNSTNKNKTEIKPTIDNAKHPTIDFEKIVTYNPIEELQVIEKKNKPEPLNIPIDQPIYNPEKELAKFVHENVDQEDKDFIFWINNIGKKANPDQKTLEKENSPNNVQILLDQFLATKRSRPIENRSFYNAKDRAEASDKDDMELISETLINVYVSQGYYHKAIAGFEKLSLQNPNKSSYFAARIKEIKDKLTP